MNNIVVFEDNTRLSSYWRSLLESNHYQVRCCETISDALELVIDRAPDLLIVDMMIKKNGNFSPEGGITLLHRLATIEYKPCPILGISGYKANHYRGLSALEVSKSMGVDLALYKPITPQKFLEAVSHLIQIGKPSLSYRKVA